MTPKISLLRGLTMCLLMLWPADFEPAYSQTNSQNGEQRLAAELVAAKTDAERQAILEREPELQTSALALELVKAANALVQQDSKTPATTVLRLPLYLLAERIAVQAGDTAAQIVCLTQRGRFFLLQTQYRQASDSYQQALSLAERFGSKTQVANLLHRCAQVHYRLGELAQALMRDEESLRLYQELGDKTAIADCLHNLSIIYRVKGEHHQAMSYGVRNLRLREELGDKLGVAESLNSLGNLYVTQSSPAQAHAHFQQSLKLMEELNQTAGVARVLHNIANAYTEEKNPKKAQEYYQKSLVLTEKLGDKEGIVKTLYNIGYTYRDAGDYAQALEYSRRALKMAEELGMKTQVARATQSLCYTHYLKGDYAQAIALCKQGISLAKEIDSLDVLSLTQYTLAKAEQAFPQPEAARRTLTEAIETAEQLHARAAGDIASRLTFFDTLSDRYQIMVDLLVDQGQTESAHGYAQRLKGRVLLETLRAGNRDLSVLSDSERAQERQLRERLVALNKQSLIAHSKPSADAAGIEGLNAELSRVRLKLEAHWDQLAAAHPEWRPGKEILQPLALSEIAGLLKNPETAILDYVLTERKTYLFVLTSDSAAAANLQVYTVEISRKKLEDRIKGFRLRLANRNAEFREPARELFRLLLQPAYAQLQNKTSLVIIPNGVLWELPFQTLVTAKGHYLIEDHAVSYAPSLPVLREMGLTRFAAGESRLSADSLLAFGPPSLPGQKQAGQFMSDAEGALPPAEKQVKELQRLPGVTGYTGKGANETLFKREAGKYKILHFATHGKLDDKNPLYSALRMAPTEKEDGLLEVWEILALNLKADLAVLAACETARGRVSNGEGLIGVSWAFLIAGCPTTIASQWAVKSAGTTALMTEFYKQLRRAENQSSVSDALRQATLSMMRGNKYNHPFYWASFISIGAPQRGISLAMK